MVVCGTYAVSTYVWITDSGVAFQNLNAAFFYFSEIDVELARSIEERIMLEDAQSWMNGRKIKEIKDKSGTLNSSVVLFYAILYM